MTHQDLDRIVRDVLGDLAGEARPAPLLDGTVRRARRIRHRRAATAGAAALAVVAALAVSALTGGSGDPHVPSRPSPSTARVSPSGGVPVLTVTPAPVRVELPDGFTVTAIGAASSGTLDEPPVWIYNRDTRTYVATPYAYASVAPSGTRAVVQTRARVGEVLLVDLRDLTARPRRMPSAVSTQMWHPDARTVLDGGAVPGWLHLVDVVSEVRTDVLFQAAQVGCDASALCGAAWYPGGAAVTVAVFDPSTGAQTGTQVISVETGATIRSLPVTGYIAGACSWSTDGRYVVTEVRPDSGDPWLEIVEAATGRRTARLPAMAHANPDALCWSSPTRLLIVDGGHVKVFTSDGTAQQDIAVPGAAWVNIGRG